MDLKTISSPETIDSNYIKLLDIIKSEFKDTPDRIEKLNIMYADYEERIKESPASGQMNFHLAIEGGYLQHILNVIENSLKVVRLYKECGGRIDFSRSELVFAAMHHDLGKLGTLDDPYYLPQDSEWHRENKLETYKHNDDRQFMDVSDTSLFILQSYGIMISQKEYLGIILADGMYSERAKKYLVNYRGLFPMRTRIGYILHWADHISTNIEKDIVAEGIY